MFSLKALLILSMIAIASGDAFAAPADFEARNLQARQSWLSGTQSGDATFFGVGLGACGTVNSDTDFIIALSVEIFDNYPGYNGDPEENPVCGKQINVSYQGETVQVMVVDECSDCQTADLGLSLAAFQVLADESTGRIPVTWEWA